MKVMRLSLILYCSYRNIRNYGKLCHLSAVWLACVLLIVYIIDVHAGCVSLIDSDTFPTGILGIMVKCIILSAVRLVGVLLIVYIKDIHVGHVSLIDSDNVPTGIVGIMVSCVILSAVR